MFFVITGFLLSAMSCSPERKLAKTFIKNDKQLEFLLMSPEYLYKVNLKKYELDGEDTSTQWKKDSILLAKSLFLKNIDDTIFLKDYMQGFAAQLRKYGLAVYPESDLDSLMKVSSKTFIVNVAQFSVEEYVHPFTTDQEVSGQILTIKDIDLNALNFNTWIELSRMNTDTKRALLFSSDQLFDKIDGSFKQYFLNPDITFEYTIDTITISDIYKKARLLGEKDGAYLFDYLMNKYIQAGLPENFPFEPQYFYFDPESRRLHLINPDEGDAFIEMKDNE